MSNGLVRQNLGATVDHVFVQNGTTVWNASVAFNRFTEGNRRNAVQTSFSPGAVGFPAYMDERARAIGGDTHLPRIDFSDNSYSDFGVDRGAFTDYSVITARGELAKILSTHSVKTGVDIRQHRRENIAGGNTSGVMTPRNDYVRQRDNTNNAGLLGLEWASFMLGLTGITMDNNTTQRVNNPYYAAYVQDDWRVSNRITLNLGVRVEYEGGFVEADNRAIGEFDFDAELPISEAAEQAYLRNPIAGVPSIEVRGGSLYAGLDGAPEALSKGQYNVMPRLGAVWKLNDKTVLRGGYGLFYDTNNVFNSGIDQSGFSRGTGRTLTNNNGLTFVDANLAAGRSILHDPFPVREDGTRFNEPFGNALGISAKAGRGFDYEATTGSARSSSAGASAFNVRSAAPWSPKRRISARIRTAIRLPIRWPICTIASTRCRGNSGRPATSATTRTPTSSMRSCRTRSTSPTSSSCARRIPCSIRTWPRTDSSRRRPSAAINCCARSRT